MAQRKRPITAIIFGLGVRLLLGLAVVLTAGNAVAVNIIPIWENNGVFPEEDPDGLAMRTMMPILESYLEDIFEASGTLVVYYGYMEGGFGVHNNLATSGGKPTSCRIKLSAAYDWWYDPTPLDDSEFNLVSKRASQFTSSSIASWYNGSVPDLLEVQREGYTKWDAPSAAKNHFDAWTVLMHEMGHGLGMTGRVAGTEYEDDDYDFHPSMVWGNTVAAKVGDPDNNHVHIAAPALMRGGETRGRRKIFSATDIFAIETAADWGSTAIDLRRKDFYNASATASWNANSNWAGNRAPDEDDEAYIRHGGTVSVTSNIEASRLQVDYGSGLDIAAGKTATIGTLDLNNGSTLGMELGGLTHGVNLAWMHVTGGASIDGTLDLSFADGYDPVVGDIFDLFDFDGGFAGSFDAINAPEDYAFDMSLFTSEGKVILIDGPNYAPIAVEDSYTTFMNETLEVSTFAEGVLGNDTDPNGDDLDVYYHHPTSTGVVTMNMEDGTFTFAPREDFVGDTWFWYRAVDEEGLRSEYSIARISVLAPDENTSPVPEPGTCALLLAGVACLLSRRRRTPIF